MLGEAIAQARKFVPGLGKSIKLLSIALPFAAVGVGFGARRIGRDEGRPYHCPEALTPKAIPLHEPRLMTLPPLRALISGG
jgi:hypothetical protein